MKMTQACPLFTKHLLLVTKLKWHKLVPFHSNENGTLVPKHRKWRKLGYFLSSGKNWCQKITSNPKFESILNDN